VVRAAAAGGLVSIAGGEPVQVSVPAGLEAGTGVQVAIRPESLRLVSDGRTSPTRPVGSCEGRSPT
jgi:hypothetical protein